MEETTSQSGSLSEFAARQLASSGISPEFTALLQAGGYISENKDGLGFQYPLPDGTPNGFTRTRLVNPTGSQKYTQPRGTGCMLYFASSIVDPETLRSGGTMFITEGEKKSLALVDRLNTLPGNDRCVVGLGGVWNFLSKDKSEGKKLLEQFDALSLQDRIVYIIFDSDVETNPQVRKAEGWLAQLLRERGASVRLVTLPTDHKAIDDWLVVWGDDWQQQLGKLCQEAVTKRQGTHLTGLYRKVYTMGTMVSSSFPLPNFFVGSKRFGLVAEGMVTFIHGPTNLGKTYFSTQMAYSIASGMQFLGFPVTQGKVLMLQGELPPGLFAESRLKPIIAAGYPPVDDLMFLNFPWDLGGSSQFKETFSEKSWQGFAELERYIDKYQPSVLFIDPLQSYNNLVESSNDQIREFVKRLKKIAVDWNIGVVVVDHDKKDGDGGLGDMRGASAKADLADCAIGLRPNEETGDVFMAFDKVRYISTRKPGPVSIRLESPFFVGAGSEE